MNVITDSWQNADSYVDFWKLSGVDFSVGDAAENWFELSKAPVTSTPTKAASQPLKPEFSPNTLKSPRAQDKTSPSLVDAALWPTDLIELQKQISAGVAFPGNHFGRHVAAHSGLHKPALMIVGDVPEIDEIDSNSLAIGRAGRLMESMAAMLGIKSSQVYYTALATTRPGSGAIPEGLTSDLAAFFLHCCKVIQPQQILIMGPAACQVLLGVDFMQARGNLHYINHDVGNVAAVTSFHPRTLLSNPALKAAAWQDLQMLTKKEVL